MKRLVLILTLLCVFSCSKTIVFEEPPQYYIEYTVGQELCQFYFYGTEDSRYELKTINNQNVLIVWIDENMAKFAIKTYKDIVVLRFIRI